MGNPDFKKVLQGGGFRATPGRIKLLELLAAQSKPLSVADIQKKLKKEMGGVSVYRALEAFAQVGLIRRVDLGHGHTHWEMEQKHHHHLVCTGCGVIEDIESAPLERAVAAVSKNSRRFKSMYSHNLEFFGSCKSCSR